MSIGNRLALHQERIELVERLDGPGLGFAARLAVLRLAVFLVAVLHLGHVGGASFVDAACSSLTPFTSCHLTDKHTANSAVNVPFTGRKCATTGGWLRTL